MKLTPQQHDAVHRIGQDVCVIAGPGSGKTRVLAERFSWLVADQGISPRNILALTFTDKAASEMEHIVLSAGQRGLQLRVPVVPLLNLLRARLSDITAAEGEGEPDATE